MHNPYDILEVTINGHQIHARPFEFDSEPTNLNTLENAQGRLIRPTKLNSVCPDCGQGLVLELDLTDAPEGWSNIKTYLTFNCHLCNNQEEKTIADPFFNPVEEGRVEPSDLDPLLVGMGELEQVETTVADRMEKEAEEVSPKPKKTVKKKSATSASKSAKKKKKAKKKAPKKAAVEDVKPEDLTEKWPPLDDEQ